jgi:hypothetical protein
LNATRDSFDFNEKTKYVLSEYLTENTPKLQRHNSGLVIPTYKPLGYEVAYINSNGNDYVQTNLVPSFVSDAQTKSSGFDSDNADKGKNREETLSEQEKQFEESCNIPVDGSVDLIELDGIKIKGSPRFEAFQCRLEEVKKTPMKLELTRAESL